MPGGISGFAPAGGGQWLAKAERLRAAGDAKGAAAAYERHLLAPVSDPALREAQAAAARGELQATGARLKSHLARHPRDVQAIRLLGQLALRMEAFGHAEALFRRGLALAPDAGPFRQDLAAVLVTQGNTAEALAELETLLARQPRHPEYRYLKAAALARIGKFAEASKLYAELVKEYPGNKRVWLSHGHILRTLGDKDAAIAAFRRAIDIAPDLGQAWWDLANMKTAALGEEDIARMRAVLAGGKLPVDDRFHIEFALAKATEDTGDFAASFAYYEKANSRRRTLVRYDRARTTAAVDQTIALTTREFFAERAGQGCPAPDPIFILGMPRSGSTLLEQILAAHSAVEGTMELPDLLVIARSLRRQEGQTYWQVLRGLDAGRLRALGEEYLERTRVHRVSGRPLFIDKLPNNWLHAGLIHLILPNARIIDARRDAVGCCLSIYKQHFAQGANYTYTIDDLAAYYRDYVRLMAHFDAVLPGRIHRVQFENLLDDTEGEVRRLLDYLGLPFEAGCLRFWESDRPVYTPSAEQVRRPINRAGVDAIANFAPFLGPLRAALGDLAQDPAG